MNGSLIVNKKPRVLVTRRWPSAIESKLSAEFDAVFNRSDTPLSATDFRQAFSDFDAILPTVTDKLGPEVLDMAQARTKILANYGVGYSHIENNRHEYPRCFVRLHRRSGNDAFVDGCAAGRRGRA
jgi:phosphoglycerate dehydrogenase-like enzyme